MATKDRDDTPHRGKYFIVKRPQVHTLMASWLSPPGQEVYVTFEVIDSPLKTTQRRTAKLHIRSLTRSHDFQTIWFSGFEKTDGGSWLRSVGFVYLPNQSTPLGIIWDMSTAITEMQFGDLGTEPVKLAMQEAAAYAEDAVGIRWLGEEIATRVINVIARG